MMFVVIYVVILLFIQIIVSPCNISWNYKFPRLLLLVPIIETDSFIYCYYYGTTYFSAIYQNYVNDYAFYSK